MSVSFDLALPGLRLEGGATVANHVARVWIWGPEADARALSGVRPAREGSVVRRTARELEDLAHTRAPRLDPRVPTVLVVHALTGDARAGGEGGWWAPLVGPGRALDPREVRVVGVNLLGSCYGSSGPCDEGFPTRADDEAPPAPPPEKGGFTLPRAHLPATITTADQARAILAAMDALGVERIALAVGGSLGGMVVLALAALAPERVERIAPIAACEAASSWIVALNHVGRQAIVTDPGFPEDASRGLSLARQLAMISYRAEAGLDRVQGARAQAGIAEGAWSPHAPYRVQTYLQHQGEKLVRRFDARAYLALTGAMDHHDLARIGGAERIRASTLAVAIDTDQLYFPAHTTALVAKLRARGVHAREATLSSPHGHDAFLIEWEALDALVRRALTLPPPETI